MSRLGRGAGHRKHNFLFPLDDSGRNRYPESFTTHTFIPFTDTGRARRAFVPHSLAGTRPGHRLRQRHLRSAPASRHPQDTPPPRRGPPRQHATTRPLEVPRQVQEGGRRRRG